MELLKIHSSHELAEITAEAVRYRLHAERPGIPRRSGLHVALPGGRSVEPVISGIQQLSSQVLKQLSFYLVDERYDRDHNQDALRAMGLQGLVNAGKLSEEQLQFPQLDLSPEACAAAYSTLLPEMDVFFIGAGEDGHAASLFPGKITAAALNTETAVSVVTDAPKPPPVRITMTPRYFRRHHHTADCYLLFIGSSKLKALELFLTTEDPAVCPASLFKSFESLKVITDQEVSL